MALSWNEVEARISQQGWKLEVPAYTSQSTFLALCKKGHRFIGNRAGTKGMVPCSYCTGIKATPEMVEQKAQEQGFSVLSKLEGKEDRSGNVFIPKHRLITLLCSNEHQQNMTVLELFKNKECTACKGTRAQTAYSRSEEIIAGVLDHLSINYVRQAVTDTLHEQLKLDFLLPDHKVIIEYDGAHHRYGRTNDRSKTVEEVKRTDEIRDQYAETIGFEMVRINHYNIGKGLVYTLAELFPTWGINVLDPYYDTLVKTIYDYAHDNLGWYSYDKIKSYADLYQRVGLKTAHETLGRSKSRLQLDYVAIYGKKKKK